MIDVEQALTAKFPEFPSKPSPIRWSTLFLLRRLVREREVNEFLNNNSTAVGFEFVDRVLDYFDFGFTIGDRDLENIPSSGRVLIVANHPLGALDGLALLKLVGKVRRDVKIVANDVLMNLQPLAPLLLPVDNLGRRTGKGEVQNILSALQTEQAVIIFPAGEVSRAGFTGIRDGKWNNGFMRLAKKANVAILPVFIGGKNSALFYGLSWINRSMSTLLLVREMFRKRRVSIPIRVGEAIPFSQINGVPVPGREKAKLLKRHLYRIARGRKPLFVTEKTIAHPQGRQALKQELRGAELLGSTDDGMKIFLFDYAPDSAVMNEIGRLREIAFRCVGEGTGGKRDIDGFDRSYRHLVLWDEDELEIVGAYRLGEAAGLSAEGGRGLYSATLFRYEKRMQSYLDAGIELGRSFVQPKYWGRRSLDYLWFGIGAYLRRHPQIRYLFGPVSLSNSFPQRAKDLLVYFYSHYFPDPDGLARSYTPYVLGADVCIEMDSLFRGDDYAADFALLKEQLDFLSVRVPTLYKQYSEVCEPDGVRFLDFGVDAAFNFCVDGLVLVDLSYLKARKRQRYLGE